MNLKIVMCEGAHDIAFLSKILLANGYESYNKHVKEYPRPLGKYIEGVLSAEPVGDKKLGFSSSYTVPYVSYCNKNSLVLFHNMGGDATLKERMRLIADYRDIEEAIREYLEESSEIDDIEFYLFYDADDFGINGRISKIQTDFGTTYHISSGEIQQGKMTNGGDIHLGVYIFHDPNECDKKGTLEDQVLALMEIGNKEILGQAASFVNHNVLASDRTCEYVVEKDSYKTRSQYEEKKSIISVAGQLQFSGVNNSVVIAKSDYIKKDLILHDTECIKIFQLLDR